MGEKLCIHVCVTGSPCCTMGNKKKKGVLEITIKNKFKKIFKLKKLNLRKKNLKKYYVGSDFFIKTYFIKYEIIRWTKF